MQSNLEASPANSFSEGTLFDLVPCNVNAILIDENRLSDVSVGYESEKHCPLSTLYYFSTYSQKKKTEENLDWR